MLSATKRKRSSPLFWEGLLSALLLGAALTALRALWGSLAPARLIPAAAAAAGWLLWTLADRSRPALAWMLRLAPWVLGLPWAAEAARGALLWLNCGLSLWNQLHRDGLALFSVQATAACVVAAAAAAGLALGQLTAWAVSRRRALPCAVLGLAVLLGQLLTGTFAPLPCGLWLSGLLGLWMSPIRAGQPSRQAVRLWGACTAALYLCALLGTQTELTQVIAAGQSLRQQVHTLRYGADPLPQGQLSQAARLSQGEDELLRVYTEQEKALYLRAYVGADYDAGTWSPLPGAAYGDSYSGMLDWLAQQGFDPLTQPAAYYALSDPDTAPESNALSVQVTGGTRCYLYLPSTVEHVGSASYREKRDQRLTPRGLLGARAYTAEEYSSARPAELTVRADWVEDPQTEEQARYAQAEAVYRTFVYERYTTPDPALKDGLERLFWEEYAPEHDGIYSAVDRVRSVLRQRTTYTRDPAPVQDGTDPIGDFLNGSRRGNAVLYASAAVQALRTHGIPARYVEGYYLSASAAAASPDGTVSLTGQDAHAWVEIYFDGIGWLPVDVTPGYYLDAVALRQMVALPETVRKTASLDNGTDAGLNASAGQGEPARTPPVEIVRDTALLLLGLIALLAILAAAWLLVTKLTRHASNSLKKLHYDRAAPAERIRLLHQWIYAALSAQGTDACLGWQAQQTDAEAAARFADVAPGEYTRTAALLEKFIYGGAEPEAFELRTLQAFLEKIYPADWKASEVHLGLSSLLHRRFGAAV